MDKDEIISSKQLARIFRTIVVDSETVPLSNVLSASADALEKGYSWYWLTDQEIENGKRNF